MEQKDQRVNIGLAAEPLDARERKTHRVHRTVVGVICLGVLGITLTAGLWPFHVPTNQVAWLKGGSGLQFGRQGSMVTAGAIRTGEPANASATLELWLEAANDTSTKTIFSFYGSAHPGEPFSLHQKGGALGIRQNNTDDQGISRTALFYVDGVFEPRRPVFVTVALADRRTSVYLNGVLAKEVTLSRTWNDLTGRVVVANSPTSDDSWSGKILGLVMYPRELTSAQIAADYASWKANRRPLAAAASSATSIYLFDEGHGTLAHNEVNPATDLIIPNRYFLLHPAFLLAPWREYHPTRSYWKDVALNIAGFVPLGLCVCAYLSELQIVRRPGAATVILGFLTSLTIELLQALLPTRSSGTTDLITNTLGTAIGVMAYLSAAGQLKIKLSHRRPIRDLV
jgi:VanZ family protein